jgi:hypothetical protein
MKKIVLGSVLLASSVFAEVVTVLPYGGIIDYDSDSAKSVKDKATLAGVHASVGTLKYLLEADYSHIRTKYKDSSISNLNQDDISLAYAMYFDNFMFRIGDHYINTNDEELGDANIVIAGLGGYNWDGYDKYSYGVDGYYSTYSDGHDEDFVKKSISITQLSPYASFYKYFNKDMTNTVLLKVNYQMASDYKDDNYTSFEVSDTFGYKNFFTTLKYYGGDMRTGVKDGGFTVFNTLDLMKDGFDVKLGYYLTPNATLSISYGQNNYEEYDQTTFSTLDEGTNSVTVATFSYTY